VAVLSDGTPIPATVLARLACDSEISRVVFGPASQVLDVGRAERLYTGAMRPAVVARDRHCAYPGCFRTAGMSEVHHVRHWAAQGGQTSVENGVLLCWWHHQVVHERHLVIRRDRIRDRWEFRERDGTAIERVDEHAAPPVRVATSPPPAAPAAGGVVGARGSPVTRSAGVGGPTESLW
jgi:hypothetical protein